MEIENKTPNILLASPTGGKVDTGYLVSCLRLQKLINDKGWGLSFSFSISSYIHRERNKQALEFSFTFIVTASFSLRLILQSKLSLTT